MSPASAVAQVHYAQAWGNLNLFDFNDRLLSDKVSLHLWPMPQSNEELLYPIGIPGNDVSSSSSCSYIIFRVPACERSKKRFMSSCSCVRMHTGSSGSLIIVPVLGSNPNPDSPCLEIEFESYSRPVVFPDDEQIEDYCQWIEKRNRDSSHFRHSTTYMSSPTTVSPCYHESPLP